MAGSRWLYAWGLGSIAQGGASLLVPLYIVALGADPIALGADPIELGLLAATAVFAGAPGALLVGRLADRLISDGRGPPLTGAFAGIGFSPTGATGTYGMSPLWGLDGPVCGARGTPRRRRPRIRTRG